MPRGALLTVTLLAACSSGSGSTPPSSFFGTYQCTYSGNYKLTGSSDVVNNPAYTATGVVQAGTTTDLLISGLLSEGIAGNCTATLNVVGTNTADYVPGMQSCQFTESNGNDQTNTGTGSLVIAEGGQATMNVNGSFTGTTPLAIPYSGIYTGAWNCQRCADGGC